MINSTGFHIRCCKNITSEISDMRKFTWNFRRENFSWAHVCTSWSESLDYGEKRTFSLKFHSDGFKIQLTVHHRRNWLSHQHFARSTDGWLRENAEKLMKGIFAYQWLINRQTLLFFTVSLLMSKIENNVSMSSRGGKAGKVQSHPWNMLSFCFHWFARLAN